MNNILQELGEPPIKKRRFLKLCDKNVKEIFAEVINEKPRNNDLKLEVE